VIKTFFQHKKFDFSTKITFLCTFQTLNAKISRKFHRQGSGSEKTRVDKNPGFFIKPSPGGFLGFIGFYWFFLGLIGFFGFFLKRLVFFIISLYFPLNKS